MSYVGNDTWLIRHDRGQMYVTTYPYLNCRDIEGYLRNGEWSIEPGQTVIDAGGCFGEFSLYASQCVGPTGLVLMLEPDESNIAIAKKNFLLNGNPSNIKIVTAGLWNKRGSIQFATGNGAESAVVGDSAQGLGIVNVPTLTLVDLVSDYQLANLDFVKMDIEGAELEALSVIGQLPSHMKPKYAIASYHQREGDTTAKRCEESLRAAGYNVSTGNPKHLTTWASI